MPTVPNRSNAVLLGTWNHRGVLKDAYDLNTLCEDINSKGVGICAIQETEFETNDEQFKEVWINKCLLLFYTRGKKRQKDGTNSKGSSDEKDTVHFYMVLTHIYRQEEDYVNVSWMR